VKVVQLAGDPGMAAIDIQSSNGAGRVRAAEDFPKDEVDSSKNRKPTVCRNEEQKLETVRKRRSARASGWVKYKGLRVISSLKGGTAGKGGTIKRSPNASVRAFSGW
jgi:polyphosphate kinase 2 (PPK2 family)